MVEQSNEPAEIPTNDSHTPPRRRWEPVAGAGSIARGCVALVVAGFVILLAVVGEPSPGSGQNHASSPVSDTREALAPQSQGGLPNDTTSMLAPAISATAYPAETHATPTETRGLSTDTSASASPTPTATLTATGPNPPAARLDARAVTLLGDSVMLGAEAHLTAALPGADLYVEVSLQVDDAIGVLYQKAAAGTLGDIVVVHLGHNGTFEPAQFDEIMAAAGGRAVIFVNVNVPRPWQDANNAVLATKTAQYSNAVLVDWYAAIVGHPEYFDADGVHLSQTGATVLTGLIVDALGG